MLDRIVNILNSSNCEIDDGTLFCNNHIITDSDCINYLETMGIIENNLTSANVGDVISLELSLAELNSIGYYESIVVFILKNKYSISQGNYYIEELKCYNTDNNEFVNKYLGVIRFIDSVKKIARYNHTDVDTDNSLIFREDKALLLPFIYEDTDITQINNDDIEKLKSISLTFESNDSDNKKLLYINELIDFLSSENENDRFKFLLSHIAEFSDRANNAYQYYIRNFSYNKLKTELDNAALDYSKKIQSVINDAQTKLIAIPTAFLLATASMDFAKIVSGKNIGIIVGLFIFAWLIELFIKAGQYETRQRGNGKHEYFRFLKPQMADFPFQIEIFARKPDVLEIAKDTWLTPIPVDEDLSSLSAILMNDDYYHFTLEHSIIEDNIRLANIESLIVLKAKAFIDLSDRKTNGEVIDENNIRKHKNDILRLATMLTEVDKFTLSIDMQDDMNNFCQKASQSLPDNAFFKSIGLPAKPEDVFALLCNAFQINRK